MYIFFTDECIPHFSTLLLGDRVIAVVEEISVPHADPSQIPLSYVGSLQRNALRIIVPHLMDVSFAIL